jgi:uncharacterized repeat protein (TIGR03803 family)
VGSGSLAAQAVTPLYSFTNNFDGGAPQPGLIQSANGVFYGATLRGGSNGFGALFGLTTSGLLTPWHAFNNQPDGANPAAGLTWGTNGFFYGMTPLSGLGPTNQGTIYQIAADGAFTTLYSFPPLSRQTNGNGAGPAGSLVQGTNGQFYGVTSSGGSRTNGTIFSIDAAGLVTLRYTFTNGLDGGKPLTGLFLSSDGNFYGTTSRGGTNDAGTIFELTHSGALRPLYSLNAVPDGSDVAAPLLQTSAGLLVGAAANGGTNGSGTIFQITTNGAFNVVYTFSGLAGADGSENNDGASPQALLLDAAGNYYGVAAEGGTNGEGSVFEVTPAGEFRAVYSFTGLSSEAETNAEGANPNGILQGADGNFYGTALRGGTGYGTIFKVTAAPTPTAVTFSFASGVLQYVNGQFSSLVTNIPSAATVIVEASTDLATWTSILTNTAPPPQLSFTDDAASLYPSRFYRVLIAP